jgi:hypothetical protein
MQETIMTNLRWVAVVGMGCAVVLPGTSAFAKNDKNVNGGDWWQWALAQPTAHNPMLDTTGADCAVGQTGKVWFLAGTFGGGTVTRSCTIPKNKQLFFPIINSINFNTPNVCGQGPDDISVADLRSFSKTFIDGVTTVSAELDGQPIAFQRETSPVFTVTLPADNVFDPICTGLGLGDVPGGKFKPSVDDGFYVALDELAAGRHTLHFHAEDPSQSTSQDITYILTIESQ